MGLIMNQALKVMLLIILTSVMLVASCSTPSEAPEIGKSAPSFQISDIDGQSVSLSDFRGKPVLLNFWATWCSPCRVEMPYIQEVYDEWSERGLVVLAVNRSESPSRVERFIQYYNLSFPVLLDMEGNAARQYNIRGIIPTTYFIDSSGVIQDIKVGAFLSMAEIEDGLSRIFP